MDSVLWNADRNGIGGGIVWKRRFTGRPGMATGFVAWLEVDECQ